MPGLTPASARSCFALAGLYSYDPTLQYPKRLGAMGASISSAAPKRTFCKMAFLSTA